MVIELNSAVATFGVGGFITAIVAFVTVRTDVKNLTAIVMRLDTDRDTVTRHDVEIQSLKADTQAIKADNQAIKAEVQKLAGRVPNR